MDLPPLYKYLDSRGAELTLANGTFKHSKPSDFNDTEDLTVQSIFPVDVDAALAEIEASFIDIVTGHLNDTPTCDPPLREQLALIQKGFKLNSAAVKLVKEEIAKEPVYDRKFMRRRSEHHIQELNEFMQRYRIFCVTTHHKNEHMWTEYAEDHRGVMVRISPCYSKDSKFKLFRPVQYEDARPSLYSSVRHFVADSLFGDRTTRIREIVEKIIYTKTRLWEHEGEYRLAIPLAHGEESWDLLPYHPEEISEIYLGAEMQENKKKEIMTLALIRNPQITLFEVNRSRDAKITYIPLQP